MFPVKYMEKNLIFHTDGAVYAYYELKPYNYSMVGEDRAEAVMSSLARMTEFSRSDEMHMLLLSTEESITATMERSRACVRGKLKETAYRFLDGIEAHLKRLHGENEIGYRFYIGYRLKEEEEQKEQKRIREEIRLGFGDVLRQINRGMFADYERIDNKEISRYLRLEGLLRNRITRQLRLRPVTSREYGYIIEHLNGQRGTSYDDYRYEPRTEKTEEETRVKTYDLVKLSRCLIEEEKRNLVLEREEGTQYVSFLVLSGMTGENDFPGESEVMYFQQGHFDFPVDVSVKISRLKNPDAIRAVRNKKADLKDIDESAAGSGHDAGITVWETRRDAGELEERLQKGKQDMYKISYVVRVCADTRDELRRRVTDVTDFYRDYNMVLERPLGDQLLLFDECYPAAPRKSDYVEYVTGDFLASLGFGATRKLGEKDGIYAGYNAYTGEAVFLKPWLAAQGVENSVTNALAKAFTGSLGGGKSFAMNLLLFYTALFGGRVFVLDPKGERIVWKERLGFLGDELNIISITSEEKNRGLLDPFTVFKGVEEQIEAAVDVLTFLTGTRGRDGERFPVLYDHVKKVAEGEGKKGMLCVIEELRKTDTPVSRSIAAHIESFTRLSVAGLLFGDGTETEALDMDCVMNVVLVQDLRLPEWGTPVEEYTVAELLSVSILLMISMFSLKFINRNREVYKQVVLDESWTWLQVNEGKALSQRLIRAGRAMNAGIDFGTQNCRDLAGEQMKNNIGMKFAFRSTDISEIRQTLEFFGLEEMEENIAELKNLRNGECLFQDIYGTCGVLHFDYVFRELYHAWDTTPPMKEETEETEGVEA